MQPPLCMVNPPFLHPALTSGARYQSVMTWQGSREQAGQRTFQKTLHLPIFAQEGSQSQAVARNMWRTEANATITSPGSCSVLPAHAPSCPHTAKKIRRAHLLANHMHRTASSAIPSALPFTSTQHLAVSHAPGCAHLVCVLPHRNAKCTRQPKVSQLERVGGPVDKQVLWLEVAMQNSAFRRKAGQGMWVCCVKAPRAESA